MLTRCNLNKHACARVTPPHSRTQWEGVAVLTPEEEEEAEGALRRAARPGAPLQELTLAGQEFAVR